GDWSSDVCSSDLVDVSPPKWHLGHTTWFFDQFLLGRSPEHRIDEKMAHVFNSYYEGAGERVKREERGRYTRPTVEEVMRYRERVDQAMEDLIGDGIDDEGAAILELGLNHEEQHQELLVTDIKFILCQEPLFPAYGPFNEGRPEHNKGKVQMPEGRYPIGFSGEGFCFDLEKERHEVLLRPYGIDL